MINNNYKHINLEYLYEMADGEDDFVIDIVNNCLDSFSPNIEKLAEVTRTGNPDDITFQAHKLKGSFAFIGCNDTAAILAEIEHLATDTAARETITTLITKINEQYLDIEKDLRDVLKQLIS